MLPASRRRDFGGFALGAMVAPEVVIVQRNNPGPTGTTLEPVVSSAMASIWSPRTPAA
jgi:hypothetical protein